MRREIYEQPDAIATHHRKASRPRHHFSWRAECHRKRAAHFREADHRRQRLQSPRRPRRRNHDRRSIRRLRRCGVRQRILLSLDPRRRRSHRDGDYAVRRDRRHHRCAARSPDPWRENYRDFQRLAGDYCARGQCRSYYRRWTGTGDPRDEKFYDSAHHSLPDGAVLCPQARTHDLGSHALLHAASAAAARGHRAKPARVGRI